MSGVGGWGWVWGCASASLSKLSAGSRRSSCGARIQMASPQPLRPTVILCVLCASSFSFLLGYDIGIMSGAKRLIKREFDLSEPQLELIVGVLNLVSGPGGLLSGRLADSLGRRPSAALACGVTLCGALLMCAAQSFAILLCGRIITGVGVGCCFHVAPLYLAEIAPKHIRGRLISCFDLFINVGILAGYLAGWALAPQLVPLVVEPSSSSSSSSSSSLAAATAAADDMAAAAALNAAASSSAWRWMLGGGAIPPALNLIGLLWLPESPRFLVAVGREREANEVLQRIYAPDESAATLQTLCAEQKANKPLTLCAGLRRIFLPAKGAPRAMIVAGMGCAFWQQATGVEAAVYYTPETLEAAGISDESQLLLATVAVGMVKVLFICVAACLVESVGRVRLLLWSTLGIAVSQLLLGLSFSLGRHVPLALCGQCLFMAAFSLGSGPCSMMVASELFPLQVRGFALGVATLVNRTTSGLVALSFLSLSRALTPAGAYYLFVALALLACGFLATRVPETTGKSLEEIESEMAERCSARGGGHGGGRRRMRMLEMESCAGARGGAGTGGCHGGCASTGMANGVPHSPGDAAV